MATEQNCVICVEGTLDCVKGMTTKPTAMVSHTIVLVYLIILSVLPGR